MLSFIGRVPKKHTQAHLSTITTEDGATRVEFFGNNSNSPYALKATVKPGNTIHTPPYHWHKYQTETFFIHSGTFRATLEGQEKLAPAGDTLTVEAGLYHTFDNNSETEPLVVSMGLDPSQRERDEAFFRNLYCYSDDCRKASMAPNLAQMCLFLYAFDCYLALPGPKMVMKPISQLIVVVLGVVLGKWILGFQETYPEYYKKKGAE